RPPRHTIPRRPENCYAGARMRPLSLHTKTTLLVSAITLAVLIATLLTLSGRVGHRVRDAQKALAEMQAVNLADQIGQMPVPLDADDLARALLLVRGSRPNIVAVRVWERAGGLFVERASAG